MRTPKPILRTFNQLENIKNCDNFSHSPTLKNHKSTVWASDFDPADAE